LGKYGAQFGDLTTSVPVYNFVFGAKLVVVNWCIAQVLSISPNSLRISRFFYQHVPIETQCLKLILLYNA
jgi:hypothetical protein